MTDKEKLERIKSLADDMYNKMAYLTSDTRPIRKAMENYKHFIVHEYYKEAYMPNELDTIKVREMMVVPEPNPRELDGLSEEIMHLSKQFPEVSFAKLSRIAIRIARWQQEEMLKDTLCVHVIGNGNFHKPLYCYKGEYDGEVDGKHVDLVLIKKYESKCDDKE